MKKIKFIFRKNGSIKKYKELDRNDNKKLDKYSLDKLKRKEKWV